MGLSNRINNQTNRGKMKQLTNDIYRTKKKLELLEAEGIGQLLVDVLMKTSTNIENIIERTELLSKSLKKDYLEIIQDYKPSKQTKIEFHNG